MRTARRPSVWMGLLLALILTPVLMAAFVVGEALTGLPLLPFDLFDFIGRVLPGAVVTAGIDAIVAFIRAIGPDNDLSRTAKAVEQVLALLIFLGLSAVVSMAFYAIMNRVQPPRSRVPGWVLFATYGLPLILLSEAINRSSTAHPFISILWLGILMLYWSLATAHFYQVLVDYNTAAELNVEVSGLNRRQFLVRVGASSAVLTVMGAGLARVLSSSFIAGEPADTTPVDLAARNLPNANDPVQPVPGTRPEVTPVERHYRIDISALPPSIDGSTYRLPISGLVANPVEWSLDDIRAMPSQAEYITMACISNPIGGGLIGTTKWTGVSFQYILDQIQPAGDARGLRITGADTFDEYVSLDMIRSDPRIMLTYAWDDAPLPVGNGFPLRIHIPDRYGMKQPKWITSIEVVPQMGDGYWVRRGWSPEAIVNATSVVDTVASDAVYEDAGTLRVPVGGIAWAGARGISRVEVRVNGGDWQPARVRAPISDRTWVIWRYDWPFAEGQHTFEVRCAEGDGTPQVETYRDPRPDGSTGLHRRRARLAAPGA